MHRKSRSKHVALFTPSADDLLSPYRRYPAEIQRAILTVDTAPQFINLSRGQKAVLRAFLTRAEKSNGTRPILVNFEHAASESGVSEKTIARTVTLLLAAGWLTRCGSDRDQYGVFTYRKFRFTRMFCELIDLPAGRARGHRTSMSTPVYKDRNYKEDQLNTREGEERSRIELPSELQKLVEELVIQPTGIAKLRGIASAAGHKLIDVFVCAKPHLPKLELTGDRAFRYLQKMCDRASDYAARAAHIEQIAAQRLKEKELKQRANLFAGKRFSGAGGLIVSIFDNFAEVVRDGKFTSVIPLRDLDEIYAAIEKGLLLEQPVELCPLAARAGALELVQNMKKQSKKKQRGTAAEILSCSKATIMTTLPK